MRILLVVFFVFLFNCEDKQSSKKQNLKEKSISSNNISSEKINTEKKSETLKLDEKNAIPFFSEYEKENLENKVRIFTDFGNIDIELFKATKYHRANFIFLTKKDYFDNTQFYRVVPNFVIQAGNSDNAEIGRRRTKIGRYLLPKDTKHGFKHNRGVLSMPSSEIENPHKLASPYEFFIVTKKDGAHHLDGDYTVFGKVVAGMDVVDQINKQETDNREWPLQNIYIKKVEILD